jgi:hypothetical protein
VWGVKDVNPTQTTHATLNEHIVHVVIPVHQRTTTDTVARRGGGDRKW